MRIHYIQHVVFEDLGSMEYTLKEKGHELSVTKIYNGEKFPKLENIDWLIIMGGPMGVNNEKIYPWLIDEKKFIKEAISYKKIVLGICLGAQLIANVLGVKVYRNKYREIGWFNIKRNPEINNTILNKIIPQELEVFHWHGDTFDIPNGALRIAESKACKNQGFIFDNRVIGLQFHLETTIKSAANLIQNCRNELDNSKYVQSEKEILSCKEKFSCINKIMNSMICELENIKL
jgi:GMP synthase-like glutamine amidotransferase